MKKKLFFGLIGLLFAVTIVSAENLSDPEILGLMEEMTIDEKVSLVHAASIFENGSVPRLGIPPIVMSDGPHGVRWETGDSWMTLKHPHNAVTYLPTLTAVSATWNRELAYRFGEVLGSEAKSRGKTMILGPGVNILRTPLNGRNFEYMGEDPCLSSIIALEDIKGIQSQGTAACIKHFALNNQEYQRNSINVEADERALREIYLPAFKRAILEGNVLSIMPAYNRFRGEFCAENSYLLNKILRDEWGYLGVAVSDWGAVHSTESASAMSLDIEMGTHTSAGSWNNYHLAEKYLSGLKAGKYLLSDLNRKVYHILYLLQQTGHLGEKAAIESSDQFINLPEHQQAALDIARESIVLLKNSNEILPLPKQDISILVVGDAADRVYSNTGGSSNVISFYEKTILQGLNDQIADYENVKIEYVSGYRGKSGSITAFSAIRKASQSDYVIFCAGFTHKRGEEAEGADRTKYELPKSQLSLLKRILAVNKNTVVTVTAGSPVGLNPVIDDISTLLYSWYNGMEGGQALAEVLFGEVNPSGHLPFTIARELKDYPAHKSKLTYPGRKGEVIYSESIMNGYRHFDQSDVKPLFSFGYGLSYTTFDYSNLQVQVPESTAGDVIVSFDITNSGQVDGRSVAQLYVSDLESELKRPLQELKAFEKVALKVGESKKVTLKLNRDAFSYYHTEKGWITENGLFNLSVSTSSADPLLTKQISIIDFSLITGGIND